MSPVTPKPAAEFSTLAMTKSSDSRSTSAGIARRATSRPGLPKMSPTNRIRMLRDGDVDLRASPFLEPRQDDAQFAVDERDGCLGGVERPLEPDRPRETAERALRDMERRLVVIARSGDLVAGNQQHVAREHDVDLRGRYARQVEQDFDRGVALD